MLAYVTATTRVNGLQNKEVYYVGDVQDDGYIYFNDDISYRVPTPPTMLEHQSLNVSDVQIWYTLRNCWIRANRFTSLQVYGVDPKNIYDRLDSVESRVSSLEQRMTALEGRVSAVEGDLDTLNTNLGTFHRDIVLANGFDTLTEYLIDWRSKYDVIAGYLDEFWKSLNLLSYDQAGNTINYANLKEWMSAVKEMLQLSYTREQTNADNIYTLGTTVASHAQSIVALYQADAALDARITDNTDSIDTLSSTVTSQGNRIAGLEVTSARHTKTLSNHEDRIHSIETHLDNAYTSGEVTYDLYDAFDKIFNDSANLTIKIGSVANWINELGWKSIGLVYNNYNGNGVTLYDVYNKLNDVIGGFNALNDGGYIAGGISTLPQTNIWRTWSEHTLS